jgi:hypothetical protein
VQGREHVDLLDVFDLASCSAQCTKSPTPLTVDFNSTADRNSPFFYLNGPPIDFVGRLVGANEPLNAIRDIFYVFYTRNINCRMSAT